MCLQRPLSQLQERSLTWRLHKLAAAGDVRAKDIAELTTLRQKQVGLVQEAKNCLDRRHAHDVQQDPVQCTLATNPSLQEAP